MEGCKLKNGGITRVVLRALVSSFLPLVKHSSGMMSTLNLGIGQLKRWEGTINHAGQSSFNVNLELYNFRESLRRLKGEVDVRLSRLDMVIKNLESFGPRQGCRGSLVQKVVGSKGKGKMRAKGKSPNQMRGLKPKRKMVLSPR